MLSLSTRLFVRIISKGREVYVLKIITLAIAFACSTLILLFSLNEFGYDKFHNDHKSVFRLLERNNTESYSGNRLSNKIPADVCSILQSTGSDSILTSRVKLMEKIHVLTEDRRFQETKMYAADPEIVNIFSFEVVAGSLKEFYETPGTVILSSSVATEYFGANPSPGNKLKIFSLRDTLVFSVAAIYKDHPQNSHEEFSCFIRFDSASIRTLSCDPNVTGVYGKLVHGDKDAYENIINEAQPLKQRTYVLQPVSKIYFGPRVIGEAAKHGDHYSIIILICITGFIFFLALSSFVNLTTLTLPHRAKELAVKKLAGTSQSDLIVAFAKESCLLVGGSSLLGVALLVCASSWIKTLLSIDVNSLLLAGDLQLLLMLIAALFIMTIAPLFFALKFTCATPSRLLSSDAITFPRFKKIIMFLQLGISLFLIVASMVTRRQITYSLLKEPGRNHDQIVYVNYPDGLTNEGLSSLRATWKKINPNVIDIMATSQLPDRISSKELNTGFYFISVDRGFKDFFELEMIEGNWFKANDGDSIVIINEEGKRILPEDRRDNVIGVFRDPSENFNQPQKPVKMNVSTHHRYNFLCVRVLEVDIRRTIKFLERYFEEGGRKATVSFLNRRFEEWLKYQDRLNALSEILAIISGLLSCCAIYALSISIVRDKLKQIAIHKLCGASTVNIIQLLMREFTIQVMLAVLFFGPVTYIVLKEMLRTFVYATRFNWLDPVIPIGYCVAIITLLCSFQSLTLRREDLSSALKG